MTQPYSNIPFSIRVRGGGYAEILVYQEVISDRNERVDHSYLNTLRELNIDTEGYLPNQEIEIRPLYFELDDIKYIVPGFHYGEHYKKYNNIATQISFYSHGEFITPLGYDELLMAIDTARIDSDKLAKMHSRYIDTAKTYHLAGKELPSLYSDMLKANEDLMSSYIQGIAKAGENLIKAPEDPTEKLKQTLKASGVDPVTIETLFKNQQNPRSRKLGFFERLKILMDGKV